MSITINWQSMTPAQRDRVIAEKLFNWRPVPCDQEITIYDGGEAFCYGCHERDHISTFEHSVIAHPSYTTSMDAAWLIIEKLGIPTTLNYVPGFVPQCPEGRYPYCHSEIVELDYICGNDKVACAFARTAAEAICIAALRWVGIQVTNTIEAIPCWQLTYEDGDKAVFRDRLRAEREMANREQQLKANLQWAVNIRKLKIAEVMVPEDYFNGPVIG